MRFGTRQCRARSLRLRNRQRPPRVASLLIGILILTGAPDARGHAVLMDTDPKSEAALDGSPSRITVTFNENIGPIFLRVLDTTGKEVGSPGTPEVDGYSMFIDLADELTDGTYAVTYRVVSADTHPVGGAFTFSVGDVAPAQAILTFTESEVNNWWIPVALNRTLQFAALLLATGLALFGLLVQAPAKVLTTARFIGIVSGGVAAATFIAAVGLGGAEMLGGDPLILRDLNVWATGLDTTLEPSLWLGLTGLFLLILGLKMGFEGSKRYLTVLGVLVSTSSLLVTGHAATANPRWFMTPIVGLHLLCVAFWFGSLIPLIQSIRSSGPVEGAKVLNDFSFWAIISVALILLSGIGISIIQVESIPALFATDYGNRLLIKIGFFVALLGLAGANKLWLTPALADGAPAAVVRLRRTISFELLIILGVFGMATSLSLTTPPRALADQAMTAMTTQTGGGANQGRMASAIDQLLDESVARTGEGIFQGFETIIEKNGYEVTVRLSPGRPGPNSLEIEMRDENGEPFEAMEMTTYWALPSAGLEALEVEMASSGLATFLTEVGELIIPGTWELRVDALISDFDKIIFRTEVPLD